MLQSTAWLCWIALDTSCVRAPIQVMLDPIATYVLDGACVAVQQLGAQAAGCAHVGGGWAERLCLRRLALGEFLQETG